MEKLYIFIYNIKTKKTSFFVDKSWNIFYWTGSKKMGALVWNSSHEIYYHDMWHHLVHRMEWHAKGRGMAFESQHTTGVNIVTLFLYDQLLIYISI